MSSGRQPPALGPRGEGWVVAQFALFAAIALAGLDAAREGWASVGPVANALGLAAIVAGCALAAWGGWSLRASFSPFPRPIAGAALVQTGAYRLVRHPIYSGVVLAGLGWGVSTGSPLVVVLTGVLFVLFDLKSRREEVWLEEVLPGYPAYRARTRRFVAWLY
jgi:protein-S-isoprenylcysteine O-methyltransferase Ste14